MRQRILFTAAALSVAAAMPAFAQAVPASRTIGYTDLDLASHKGRAAMDRRIGAAIEEVCGSYAGARSDEIRAIDRCRAAARTGVDSQLAALRARNATRVALESR